MLWDKKAIITLLPQPARELGEQVLGSQKQAQGLVNHQSEIMRGQQQDLGPVHQYEQVTGGLPQEAHALEDCKRK